VDFWRLHFAGGARFRSEYISGLDPLKEFSELAREELQTFGIPGAAEPTLRRRAATTPPCSHSPANAAQAAGH
jgi:hypothetical protein